jgi:hypothetical protein
MSPASISESHPFELQKSQKRKEKSFPCAAGRRAERQIKERISLIAQNVA